MLLYSHITLFPRQLVFGLIPQTLSGEAANINLIVFGLTRSAPEPTIYHT